MEIATIIVLVITALVFGTIAAAQQRTIARLRHQREIANRLRIMAEQAMEKMKAAVKQEKAEREWPEYIGEEV